MINIHLEGSRRPRPRSTRTIYCDGAHDAAFRPGIDLELSHWIPNLTPARYKADTSTEIALRFVADPSREGGFDLAVNNHVDVDGVLALFVLADADAALPQRALLIEAAEMGDFQGWGGDAAQRLVQALLLHLERSASADPQDRCESAFALVRQAIAGTELPQAAAGVEALRRSLACIDEGRVERVALAPRLVHYRVPASLAAPDLARCLAVPRFDSDLTTPALLLPHARAKRDAQRLQLMSVQTTDGWFHDLLYPGYCWAETPNRWRPPGLRESGSGHQLRFDHAPLRSAAADLDAAEHQRGRWLLADAVSPFAALHGRGFPVMLSFVHGGAAAPSALPPDAVAERLLEAVRGER